LADRRKVQIAQPIVGAEEWEAVRAPIEAGWLTQGPLVAEFESRFAARHGVDAAVATTSCTTGLHLILSALGVGRGDEVIVPSFTWVATANVVVQCGATPVFVDVDPHSFNIDVKLVKGALTERTRAVIAVHLFGLCADIESLRSVVPAEIVVIEDAACAVGASRGGVLAGGLGDAAAFSFHPRKVITTGEGGMVTTNDPVLAELVRTMRNHGATISEEQRHRGDAPYLLPEFETLGFNYRMTDIQGAIGIAQLDRLDGLLAERRRWAAFYSEALEDLDWLQTPLVSDDSLHAWQSYVILVDPDSSSCSRDELMAGLHEEGVATRPGTHAVHELAFYQNLLSGRSVACPVASASAANSMAIPLHNGMVEADFAYVVRQLHELGGV
jgi:dTDP-4-amino-4,6-dideoxygalactose transaminase